MKDHFFGKGIFFSPGISFQEFFSSKSVCRLFFLKSPIPHLKSQMVGPSLEGFLWEKQNLPPKYEETSPLKVIKKV